MTERAAWRRWRRPAVAALLLAALALGLYALLMAGDAHQTGYCALNGMTLAMLALVTARPRMRREWLFLALAAGWGLCYLCLITPLSAPDESAHYRCAMHLAGQWLNGRPVVDRAYLNFDGLTGHENTAQAFQAFTGELFAPAALTGELADCGAQQIRYPLMYLPQAAGCYLAMALGLSRMAAFALGDLINLAVYAALVWAALRSLPHGKTPVMLCALLPMALQQASSLSPDGFINGMAFLFLARLILAVERPGRLAWREALALALPAVLLAPAKAVYFLLLLLLPMIPRARFARRRDKALYVLGVMALAACATFLCQLGWLREMSGAAQSGTSKYYTLGWVLRHPVQTAAMFFHTLVPLGAFFYLESAVGAQLSGLSLDLATGYWGSMILILALSILVGTPGEARLSRRQRAACLGVAALVVLAVMGTMLLAWTPVGSAYIQGVQGRYFLPVAPLVALGLANGNYTSRRNMDGAYAAVFICLQLLCLMQVLHGVTGPA